MSSATTLAKSLLAVSRVKMLRLIERQLAVYRKRIEMLFAQHPDHELFTSLPAPVPKLAPRLLSDWEKIASGSKMRSPCSATRGQLR